MLRNKDPDGVHAKKLTEYDDTVIWDTYPDK